MAFAASIITQQNAGGGGILSHVICNVFEMLCLPMRLASGELVMNLEKTTPYENICPGYLFKSHGEEH